MKFEDLCKRITGLGGEQVEETIDKTLDGVDFTSLNNCAFSKKACFILPLDKSYHEIKAVAYTACSMIVVYAFEDCGEADFVLFGVPYLDYSYEQLVRAAILK